MKKKTCQIVVSEVDDDLVGLPIEVERFQVTDDQVGVLARAAGGFELSPQDQESVRPLVVKLLKHWRPDAKQVTP